MSRESILGGPEATAPPTPPLSTARWPRWSAVITLVLALVLALVAGAVASWLVLRPLPTSSTAPFTSGQVAAARVRACTAFTTVRSAVSLQTHADLGSDPVALQAVAANARLALSAGGTYLQARLDPATPPPLATAIRSFADTLDDIAINILAGVSNDDPAQATRLRIGEIDTSQIADLCK